MKINIGPYKNWFGPYQLAEFIFFWAKTKPDEYGIIDKPDWVHSFGEWLAYGSVQPKPKVGDITSLEDPRKPTLLYSFLTWVYSLRNRKISVRIDEYDTWSMDSTLGYVILPMLKQIKEQKNGSPWVEYDDVPENLWPPEGQENLHEEGEIDDNHHNRWDWVLDEMIFAFETKVGSLQDWEDQFRKGTVDIKFKELENGLSQTAYGPNHTYETDLEGLREYQKRISNGFRLFGKYYESLWS